MAKRFVFRLETLLRVRREAFEQTQRVVTRRLAMIRQEENAIAECQNAIDAQHARARGLQGKAHLDMASLRAARGFVIHMKRKIEQHRGNVARQQQELERERAVMIRASVACKAVEKLKERQRARFDDKVRRQEMMADDETALQIYRRKRRGGSVAAAIADES